MTAPTTIRRTLPAMTLTEGPDTDPRRHGWVDLTWCPTDPDRVEMRWRSLHQPGVSVRWRLPRGLLAAGLDGPVMDGDVAVFPDLHPSSVGAGRRVELVLTGVHPQSGRVRTGGVLLPVAMLAGMLAETFQAAPAAGGAS